MKLGIARRPPSLASTLLRSTASEAADAYWRPHLAWDARSQEQLTMLLGKRKEQQRQAATSGSGTRNQRRLSDGRVEPVILYFVGPDYWYRFYGQPTGERMLVPDCSVPCELVSGFPGDSKQKDSHILAEYNYWKAKIDGLSLEARKLQPWQKTALYSMEPNTFQEWHSPYLPVSSHQRLFHVTDNAFSFTTLSHHFRSFPTSICNTAAPRYAPQMTSMPASTCLALTLQNWLTDCLVLHEMKVLVKLSSKTFRPTSETHRPICPPSSAIVGLPRAGASSAIWQRRASALTTMVNVGPKPLVPA